MSERESQISDIWQTAILSLSLSLSLSISLSLSLSLSLSGSQDFDNRNPETRQKLCGAVRWYRAAVGGGLTVKAQEAKS